MGWKVKVCQNGSEMDKGCHGVPGWEIPSDGREVSIVQHHRLLEMDVINEVIMGSGWNME